MFRSLHTSPVAKIASATVLLAVTFFGGLTAISLSGVSEVRAEPETAAAMHSSKSDRLPVRAKGSACSSLGWPHFEQSCQFDMRRQVDDVRVVRVISLR